MFLNYIYFALPLCIVSKTSTQSKSSKTTTYLWAYSRNLMGTFKLRRKVVWKDSAGPE